MQGETRANKERDVWGGVLDAPVMRRITKKGPILRMERDVEDAVPYNAPKMLASAKKHRRKTGGVFWENEA